MIQNIEFDFLDQMDQKSEITPGEDRSDSKNISEEMIEEFDQSSLVYGAVSSDQYHSLFEKACPAVYETIDGLEDFLYSSQSLMMPADGYISVGTWAYPQGGLHLGMDLAFTADERIKSTSGWSDSLCFRSGCQQQRLSWKYQRLSNGRRQYNLYACQYRRWSFCNQSLSSVQPADCCGGFLGQAGRASGLQRKFWQQFWSAYAY